MVDDLKSLKDSLLKTLVQGIGTVAGAGSAAGDRDTVADPDAATDADDEFGARSGRDSNLAKDLIVTLLTRAGKGKDEVVQILGREIGSAIAAMLRKPLSELARNQRLQVTFEFVPKSSSAPKQTREPGDDADLSRDPQAKANKRSPRAAKSGKVRPHR